MGGQEVVAHLRRGPQTTAQLMAQTGKSRNAVALAIHRANEAGNTVVNEYRVGGHGNGRYKLCFDVERPGRRVCVAPGCRTVLSASNGTVYCRRHLAEVAYLEYLRMLEEALDELLAPDENQLQLVV